MPGWLQVHTVTVEPHLGEGAHGSAYGPAAERRCLISENTQLVQAPDGTEVVSGASYLTWPDHDPPPKSRVTLPGGRTTTVILVRRVGAGLPVPANAEVMLR